MTTDARRVMDTAMSERDFMASVIDLARLNGFLVYHTHDSRRSAPGFPDIVAIRGEDLLAIETKSQRGRLTPDQEHWLRAFAGVERVQALLVKPAGWDELAALLSRGSKRSE